MGEIVDGHSRRKYRLVARRPYVRAISSRRRSASVLIDHIPDDQLTELAAAADPVKVYAAYSVAVENRGAPTVILAQTIKGYGLGEAGEGRNITHQQKKLNEDELLEFRGRFDIPISDEQAAHAQFYKPADDSPEMVYLHERRQSLGGFVPSRRADGALPPSGEDFDENSFAGEGRGFQYDGRAAAGEADGDKNIGHSIVPIVPDEARTFGMDSLFRQFGIYAQLLYEPVDLDNVLYYCAEVIDGGLSINEAGSMASFIAAGTSRSSHGVGMIPVFIYYSMSGSLRVGAAI